MSITCQGGKAVLVPILHTEDSAASVPVFPRESLSDLCHYLAPNFQVPHVDDVLHRLEGVPEASFSKMVQEVSACLVPPVFSPKLNPMQVKSGPHLSHGIWAGISRCQFSSTHSLVGEAKARARTLRGGGARMGREQPVSISTSNPGPGKCPS